MVKVRENEKEAKQERGDEALVFDSDKTLAILKKNQLDTYDELESYKALRKRRIKKAAIRMIVWLITITLVPLLVFFTVVIVNPSAGQNFFGYSVYMVTSQSMVGVFNEGDCIIVKKVNNIKEIKIGTDISFVRTSDGETVTHRVIDIITNEDGSVEYVTKGVNVPTADLATVAFEDVLGKRVAVSAFLGNLIEFFRTPAGIITFLVIFVGLSVIINVFFKLSDDIKAVGVK